VQQCVPLLLYHSRSSQASDEYQFFLGPVREYILYMNSLKAILRQVESRQLEVEKTETYLATIRKDLSFQQSGEGGGFFKTLSRKVTGPDTPEVRDAKIKTLESRQTQVCPHAVDFGTDC
jgi:hypothetical protein